MTYNDLFDWIGEHYNLTEFSNVDDLISKVKTDWIIQGLEFPGGGAEDSIRSDFADYQQSLPYTNPEAYKILQQKQAQDQLVADMLGNGQIARGYSDDMIESMNKPEVLGIDTSTIVPQKPEPTTAQQAMSGNNKGMIDNYQLEARLRQDIGETKSFFGRLARGLRGKRYRYY